MNAVSKPLRDRRAARAVAFGSASLAALTAALAGPAAAQCVRSGTTATCTGDLSAGFSFENFTSVTAKDLTTDIAPAAGSAGPVVFWLDTQSPNPGAAGATSPNIALTLLASPFGVATQSATAVLVENLAQGGADGSVETTGPNGITGQAGGDGGSNGGATLLISAATLSASMDGSGPANAIFVQAEGGAGGDGDLLDGDVTSTVLLFGGASGAGGDGGTVMLGLDVGRLSFSGPASAVLATSLGGNGGGLFGSQVVGDSSVFGGDGGDGGDGGATTVTLGASGAVPSFSLTGGVGAGVLAQSLGGQGGDGASAGTINTSDQIGAQGGDGGDGGDGGAVVVTGGVAVSASAAGVFDALRVESVGGGAGGGGNAAASGVERPGNGGLGGAGGSAALGTSDAAFTLSVAVTGDDGRGVWVRSVGAPGGAGGRSSEASTVGSNGAVLGDGPGGAASAFLSGLLTTTGARAPGIVVQSVGGSTGGAFGAGPSSAGGGGAASLTADLFATQPGGVAVSTLGDGAHAILVQSVGGGGGAAFGAVSGLASLGGTGLAGGDGGTATVSITGDGVSTAGRGARGVFVDSVGGGGGDAGQNAGVSALGGASGAAGAAGGDGGVVQAGVGVAVTTTGDRSDAVFAGSRGGGGGTARSTRGITSIGGAAGGSGGSGGDVTLGVAGGLSTQGADADGAVAQSVGGGGGDGASAFAVGPFFAQAVGGSGGTGGDGGDAGVVQQAGGAAVAAATQGDRSRGVVAQSVGGGGGHGGTAASFAAGPFAYSHAVGGSGGTGGAGGAASISLTGDVSTAGRLAEAVLAQSVGGGGGTAGSALAGAGDGAGVVVTHAVGGAGGQGGAAGPANAASAGAVTTTGAHSAGIVAEAIGGGGGASGMTFSAATLSFVSIAANVGATLGAGGGDGGAAAVTATGLVTTSGDASRGVFALSVGGGGGRAGTVASAGTLTTGVIAVDLGGSGGIGGDGAAAQVQAGAVATAGQDSAGVAAFSIGGGGGVGGLTLDGTAVTVGDLDVGLGGFGGGGGSAADATVVTTGAVSTEGRLSEGVHAGSFGGFGGAAGVGLGGAGTVNAVDAGSVSLTIGGDGGTGGGSGDVSVSTGGDVTTLGTHATAVLAQSHAGGGGRALGAGVANALDVGNVAVTVGGAGGAGAKAGTTTIETAAGTTISTAGTQARGLVAQSTGGVGGVGGFAAELSANLATSASDGVSGAVSVTLGGAGGAGGAAGAVTVTNGATVSTGDYGAEAILAQAIGGAGGVGGSVYAGNLSVNSAASVNVNVDVGGAGGAGATGGAVTVANAGAVTTDGFDATAILAQSVGGNGGLGGSTYAALVQAGPGAPENIQVSVGGAGGGGGVAGAVSVTNGGAILTQKGGSDGVFAQSIGGAGGRGGSAGYIGINLTPPVKFPGDKASFALAVNVGAGGGGGMGADAADVRVKNLSTIRTEGDRSRGVFAQSIGGGGGDGGTTSAHSFAVSDVCNALPSGDYLCPKGGGQTVSIKASVQIGGSGAGGGDGATVEVDNQGAITTAGRLSHGIYAQSIGGGGGNGGEGGLGVQAWTSNKTLNNLANLPGSFLPSFSAASFAIGGAAGASGDGGAVTVTNGGAITIAGPDPSVVAQYTGLSGGPADPLPFLAGGAGVFAQSVGGGGGDGGAGSSSLTAVATVGESGSGGGDGGDVTVTSAGRIENASGFAGVGILAQSVGGGGGTAGDVTRGWSRSWQNLNIGVGIGVQGNGGAGGNGGAVKVTTTGAIVTSGVESHGIIAQSVGGSGGMAGITPSSVLTTGIMVGSRGGGGDGGDVTVSVGAPIAVAGRRAVGVAAHSAGGIERGDASGAVALTLDAPVTSAGAGGRGLLVGSSSYKGQATGAVTIAVGTGGGVATGAAGAETIGVVDAGPKSGLVNAGAITSGNAASYALRVDTAFDFDIANTGTLAGAVLGTSGAAAGSVGVFAFDNAGLFAPGATVSLGGAASSFASSGTIAPGGAGALEETTLDVATATLEAGGVVAPDFDPSAPRTAPVVESDVLALDVDALAIEGTAVAPSVALSAAGRTAETGAFWPLQSAQGFAAGDFTVKDLGAVTFTVATSTAVQPGLSTLVVDYVIDTTPWRGAGAARVPGSVARKVDANHDRFGRYVQALLTEPGDPDALGFLNAAGSYVLNRPDQAALLDTYESYVADELLAAPDATLLSGLVFADRLGRCDGAGADAAVFRDGARCGWFGSYGRRLERDGSGVGPRYDETVAGVVFGAAAESDGGLRYGGGLGWETGSISMPAASGDVTRVQLGGFAEGRVGAATLGATLSGGWFGSDLSRTVETPDGAADARSDPDGFYAAAHLRAARRFDRGPVFAEPSADVGVVWLTQEGFSERGADGYGVTVDRLERTVLTLNPAVTVGHAFAGGGAATLKLGAVGLVGPDPDIDAAFVGAGAGPQRFRVADDASDLFGQVEAGVDMDLGAGGRLAAQAGGLFADGQQAYGLSLRLSWAF